MANILHIAVENFAGLPYTLVKAERQHGHESHLVTMYRTFQGFNEEYSLDLPFVKGLGASFARATFGNTGSLSTRRRESSELPPIFRYRNPISRLLFNVRDEIWRNMLPRTQLPGLLSRADIVVLDGGLGITRTKSPIADWARKKGKLVEIFYGTDLRTRGIIPEIDELAQLRFTMEFDHLGLYPGIEFLYFPFDHEGLPDSKGSADGRIRIGHSPTKRETKGTKYIIDAIESLRSDYPIELVLIEGLPFEKAIVLKSSCDIFIDQLGDLGYGVSALESLAMGIPTMVELKADFERFLGDHPFVNVNRDNIQTKLTDLFSDRGKLTRLGQYGKGWVQKKHSPHNTARTILDRMQDRGWL